MTERQRVDTAAHTLEGIVKGIAIDQKLTPVECGELINWCSDKQDLRTRHPFGELISVVEAAVSDGVIGAEEHSDLLWLCGNLAVGSRYYDQLTNEIQVLHGILHGLLADGVITDEEASALHNWTEEQGHLQGIYPFDELASLLTAILHDGKVNELEHKILKNFFEQFISYSVERRIRNAAAETRLPKDIKLTGICAVCPDIRFQNRLFCFTGSSTKAVRRDLASHVVKRGGVYKDEVVRDLHYLVVGAAGNPCWAYSCYGRKVEEAVELRKQGQRLVIVHENDFWDAIQDNNS